MPTDPSPLSLPSPADLRVALPEGRDRAHAAVDDLISRLEREARERGATPDPSDARVARFLHRCVDAVYPDGPASGAPQD